MSFDPSRPKKEKKSFIQKIFSRERPPSWPSLGVRPSTISSLVKLAKSARRADSWSIFRASQETFFDTVPSNASSIHLHKSTIPNPPGEEEGTNTSPVFPGEECPGSIFHRGSIFILPSDNRLSTLNHKRSSGDSSGRKANRESNDCGVAHHHEAKLYQELCTTLAVDVVTSEAAKKAIVGLRNEKAQDMVDFLSKVLVDDTLTQREKRRTLHLLSKLAKSAEVFPQSLELQGVQCNLTNPVTGGGYGFIYKGIREGKAICIKAVQTDSIRGIDRKKLKAHASELILWAHLAHSNILPFLGIYSSKEEVPRVCIVSPWMANGDLLQYLKMVPDISRIPLARDIILGLHYLHDFDIIHADLKAKNVLVSGTGRAMLADFGISRLSMTQTTTSTNVAAGTAYWMAPELLLDGEPPSRQSDIWAFACTCYEIITGTTPFGQYHSAPLLIRAFMKGDITPLKPAQGIGWDDGIWLVATHCWQSDPENRPEAQELCDMVFTLNCPVDHTREVSLRAKRVDGRINYASIRSILDDVCLLTAEKQDERWDTIDINRGRATPDHLELKIGTKTPGTFQNIPLPTSNPDKLIQPPLSSTHFPSIATAGVNANASTDMSFSLQFHTSDKELVNRILDKGRPIFGVDLSEQWFRDDVLVPPIVEKCCTAIEKYGLKKQGVYRVSGMASKIIELRTRLDKDLSSVDFDASEWTNEISNVTSVMKMWLKELPDPLLTHSLRGAFIAAIKINNDRVRYIRLHERVNELPDPNYSVLKYFMGHLHRINKHAAENSMTIRNLANIFGPILFGQPKLASDKGAIPMPDTFHQNLLVEAILKHYVDIFVEDPEEEA